MSFGIRLKQLRKASKVSQAELAKQTGIGSSTIADYEQDTSLPGSENLVKFAKYFNVSLDYLLGLTSIKDRHPEQKIDMVRHFERPIINGKPATDDQLDKIWEMYKIMKTIALKEDN